MPLTELEERARKALKPKKAGVIEPVRLERDSTFRFRCHPGVTCFTRCCRNMNIILTPYDIIRLKHRLGLSADAFLKLYAEPEILEVTGVPVARLRMLEDQGGKCPFVTPAGCQVYTDRPVSCRYYPIGMASLRQQEKHAGEEEEFFFLIKEDHCQGFQEPAEWTVDSWRADQEADLYDRMNRGWMELMLRKKSFGDDVDMPPKAQRLFYMVTTNAEQFRRFVFESRFLEKYEVDESVLRNILEDDVALMEFGFEFLKTAVFGAESRVVRLRPDVLQAEVEKIRRRREKERKRLERLARGRR
ncbi:YkgJ family cysteine cluster protein [Dissulfurirhabdus thermomarina]|uniref:YkgJ family cysteine cluster protein n=1 Tax=Dissulfurirhabdus thermomarina TaxID=1765737 RepID=A0A6N9TL04_DISTH|nr:YkgJ family cysteine cluster protein [Dissulfurirhabdus thermomarina]NDY41962.1 YkgJ family cysteine cluster protein [Dissulfurirhabdus thermomarina]NMX22815.1 YkgJ family cysteine cluster protein [Dissulfurirhabdus thermomarina]